VKLGLMSLVFVLFSNVLAADLSWPQLSTAQQSWIGERIYQNETGGKREHLTFWSAAEEFPSFGIGHFIWIPAGVNVPFEPTFESMVKFVSQTHPAPKWVLQPHAPWKSKTAFDLAKSSTDMKELRDWLADTKPQQADFIIQRFQQRIHHLSSQTLAEQPGLVHKLNRLMQTPQGLFALIDYVNFKGIGDNPLERYQGQGWGLVQVLQAMPHDLTQQASDKQVLELFVEAAIRTLQRRVELAPTARNETRWMAGWKIRVQGYLKD